MIVGIGVDTVSISRFSVVRARRPGIVDRIFTQRESLQSDAMPRTDESLAVRFAAKEAVAKALGAPTGMCWHDCEVVVGERGEPILEVRDSVAAVARTLGVERWHVSLTHDGDHAVAFVIGEGGLL